MKHENKKERKRTKTKTKRKAKNQKLLKRSTLRYLSNGVSKSKWVSKSKCIRVEFKKRDEVAYQVPSQIPVFIKPSTFMKDMSS